MSTPVQLLILSVVAIAGWRQRDQQAAIVYLLEENRVLKARLCGRKLRLTDALGKVQTADPLGVRVFGLDGNVSRSSSCSARSRSVMRLGSTSSTIITRGIIKARRICCCSQPAASYLSPSARYAPVNGSAGYYVSTIGKPHEYFGLTGSLPPTCHDGVRRVLTVSGRRGTRFSPVVSKSTNEL